MNGCGGSSTDWPRVRRAHRARRSDRASSSILSGYIVTEDHVVEGAQKVTATFHDGTSHPARIVGRDIKTDLALLKIDLDRKLPHVDWGDSDAALVGDWVLAVGNPFGFDASVSGGIISGRGRNMHLGPYDDFLQIDAAINVGISGGPTFDLDGRVIGINTAIYSPNGGSVGIAFAVPVALARPVIEQLMSGGRVARGWLGVRIQELTPEIASSLGLAKPEGGLVADVTSDGPAARAGFAPGDVILSVDGRSMAKKRDLLVALAAMPAGRKAEMKVWRRGVRIVLHPVIDEMPETPNIISYAPNERSADQDLGIGLNLGALTEARRQLLGISPEVKGVIVLETNESGMFAHLGLRPGDVIEAINQQQAGSPESAIASLEKFRTSGADKVLMLIHRRGTNRFLAGSLRDSRN